MYMEKLFLEGCIPQTITRVHAESDHHTTLEEVEAIMSQTTQAILPVVGDCMEAAGVADGGWVAVDFTHYPAPPRYKNKGGDGSSDLCLCYAVFPGTRTPAVMCKRYTGVWGSWQMVGTCYDLKKGKHSMNCGMRAKKIFGTIFASWDRDGRLLWERDPGTFPDKLGSTPTIHGNNVGDPMPIPTGFGATKNVRRAMA